MKYSEESKMKEINKIIVTERLMLIVVIVICLILLTWASVSGANKNYNDYITNVTEVK